MAVALNELKSRRIFAKSRPIDSEDPCRGEEPLSRISDTICSLFSASMWTFRDPVEKSSKFEDFDQRVIDLAFRTVRLSLNLFPETFCHISTCLFRILVAQDVSESIPHKVISLMQGRSLSSSDRMSVMSECLAARSSHSPNSQSDNFQNYKALIRALAHYYAIVQRKGPARLLRHAESTVA